jgi:hypothetical protein
MLSGGPLAQPLFFFCYLFGEIKMSTDVLDPIIDRYGLEIVQNGFKPLLPSIIAIVRETWNREQGLPFTVLSRLPSSVDYYEPGYDKNPLSIMGVTGALRNLVRVGASEFLHINEIWLKDSSDYSRRTGEGLHIIWQNEHDHLLWLYEVQRGRVRKYLSPMIEASSEPLIECSPINDPWHTIDDVLDWYAADEDRERWQNVMLEADAATGRLADALR